MPAKVSEKMRPSEKMTRISPPVAMTSEKTSAGARGRQAAIRSLSAYSLGRPAAATSRATASVS